MTHTTNGEHVRSSRRAAQALAEQRSRIAEDLREFGHLAISNASEALEDLRTRGGDVVERVKERGGEALQQGRERAVRARAGLEGYITAHPVQSVLIAAGVGAFVGYTLHARRRRARLARERLSTMVGT